MRKDFTIGITGHRDRQANWYDIKELLEFWSKEKKSLTVIHGGAKGFDTQVSRVIRRLNSAYGHKIKEVIIRPDYKNCTNYRVAPLKRNEKIVNQSSVVVALYDGRDKGGTYYTVNYAKKLGRNIHYLNPEEKTCTDV